MGGEAIWWWLEQSLLYVTAQLSVKVWQWFQLLIYWWSLNPVQGNSSTRTHNPLLEGNQLFLFLSSGFKVAVNQGLQFNQVFVLPLLLDVLEKQENSLNPYCSSIMSWTFPAPYKHRETKVEIHGNLWINLNGCWCNQTLIYATVRSPEV